MSDAELILIGGLLLGAGIAAAMVADRVRVPGLVLFLGLGMLVGSEGVGGVEFDDVELTRTLGTDRPRADPLRGRADRGLAGDPAGASDGDLARRRRHDRHRGDRRRSRRRWLLRPRHARGADRRLGRRGDRLGRDLRRPPRVEAAPPARPRARGRVRAERPGRRPARHRVHRLDRGARLRARRHGRRVRPATSSSARSSAALVGWGARWAFIRLDYPTPGLYPVASMAAAALAFGLADVSHGSGFLAVYLTGLALGTGIVPARRTVTAFHQGLSWVAQISLFFMLGLLVFPSGLVDVAWEGTALALILIFVARPDRDAAREPGRLVPVPRAGDAELGRAPRRRADLARDPAGDRRESRAARSSSTSSSSSSSSRRCSRASRSSRSPGGSG